MGAGERLLVYSERGVDKLLHRELIKCVIPPPPPLFLSEWAKGRKYCHSNVWSHTRPTELFFFLSFTKKDGRLYK